MSFQETRTAGIVATKLREAGFEVTEKVGGTGVVGLLRNGPGPTVAMRADMDALPIRELTGLPYASAKEAKNAKGETVPSPMPAAMTYIRPGCWAPQRSSPGHETHGRAP